MHKPIKSLILTLVLLLAAAPVALAQDAQVITFKGEAQAFVKSSDGTIASQGFTDMEPGEERTLNLVLANDAADEMRFFMSAEILDNIASKTADSQAVYDFTIAKNGTVFFSTVIGGGSAYNQSVGKEYLSEDNTILLDTLKKGESDQITVSMKLDGDSAGNGYMNQKGQIQLVFSVATPVVPGQGIVSIITQYIRGEGSANVNTGVGTSFAAIILGVALVAAAVLILWKRHKKGEEHQ